jgi:hypothetical protein
MYYEIAALHRNYSLHMEWDVWETCKETKDSRNPVVGQFVLAKNAWPLFNPETRQGFIEQWGINDEPAAMALQIFYFIEGPEQAEFGGGVLFGVTKRMAVACDPRCHGLFWKENADGIGQLAVGSYVENVAGAAGSLGSAGRLPTK